MTRRRGIRPASVVLLAALLLVPVALSGHIHVGQRTPSDPCAACAVAHHAPIVRAATLPTLAIAFSCFIAPGRTAVAPPWDDEAPPSGRAPPLSRRDSLA